MRRATVRAGVAAFAALSLTACGGVSSVFNNKDEACRTMASFDPWLQQMLPVTNVTGTIGDAQAAVATGLAETQRVRPELSDGQQDLLDRVIRALEEYQGTLAPREPSQPLVDATGGLDSYQLNVTSTYRTMATVIGCPLPPFYGFLPAS